MLRAISSGACLLNFYPAARPMTLGSVPNGSAGVAATLRAMVALARDYRKNAGVRQLAASLVRDLPQYDKVGEVRALHAFVRDNIRYTSDIRQVELLQTPQATLEMGVGDCDDKSTLLSALLESIGFKTRFIAIAMPGSKVLSHVLVQVKLGQKWIWLETIKNVEAGWAPPGVKRGMLAHV
jgi:transglutaminase-like putative cysteine protease